MIKLIIVILLTCSCGLNQEDKRCLNRDQIRVKCVNKMINEHPEDWRLPYQVQQCAQQFPVELCYYESDL